MCFSKNIQAMKNKYPLYLLLLFLTFYLFQGAKVVKQNIFKAKKIDKLFVPVGDSLYACKFEVSNVEYRCFINDLKQSGKLAEARQCAYDTGAFHKKINFSFNDNYIRFYYNHEKFNNYPVMCIPWEGAVKYCEWLTEKYNNDPKRKFKKVIFRLPTEDEWMKAVHVFPGARFPWYGDYPYDPYGMCYANLKFRVYGSKAVSSYLDDGGFFPVPENWYPPNAIGIYNIIGNVSEMINVKGKAKGGSWDTYFDEAGVDKIQEYDGGDPRVGFRVFMKVIKRKNDH
jgi:hypothetical protein